MKNKKTINYSWPASLSDFTQDTEVGNFSRGKLKVFYIGETPDKRMFSEKFGKQLVKSLPYTPVVSYYDEEKEDFVGHATQQQIYGIVDPCIEPTFETDDQGFVWCVCGVVLYTERPDKLGEIAKKIVGHPQSLELNPKTTEYVINYDEKRHFKNIEFTAGDFVGVSVLGENQKPAFTGSEFFAYNEEFEKKMQILREYCESNTADQKQGGTKMDFAKFIELSWGEIANKVANALDKAYENDAYVCIEDFYDNYVVANFYYYVEGIKKLFKVNYSIENDEVVFGNIVEVVKTYAEVVAEPANDINQTSELEMGEQQDVEVTETEPETTDSFSEGQENQDAVLQATSDTNTSEITNPTFDEGEANADAAESFEAQDGDGTPEGDSTPNEETPSTDEPAATDEETPSSDNDVVVNTDMTQDDVTDTPDKEKVSADDEQQQTNFAEETPSSATSFDSVREELETLKREKKVALVNSFKDQISEADFESLIGQVNDFEEDSLELELFRKAKAFAKTQEQEQKPMRVFNWVQPENNRQDSLDSFVQRNLRK